MAKAGLLAEDIERLALLGWRLHPAVNREGSRAACFKEATDASTSDLDQLERWSHQYPDCNWRVVMEGSGIWALDLDVHEGGENGIHALHALVNRHGDIPPRPTIRSGGGGLALFFSHRGEPITGKTQTPAPGIDPRRGRLTVTVPPSQHHRTRDRYRWIVAPWDVSPPPAPQWLLDAVRPPPEPVSQLRPVIEGKSAERILAHACRAIVSAPSGASNAVLNGQAYFVGRWIGAGVVGWQEATAALSHAAAARKIPAHEAKATILSGLQSGARSPAG